MDKESEKLTQRFIQLVAKASIDEEFKDQLVNHPKETLSKELNVDWNPEKEIKFIADTENVLYIKIPSPEDLELTDKDLQQIAAGAQTPSDRNFEIAAHIGKSLIGIIKKTQQQQQRGLGR